jgi:hypothetical protein
MSRARSASFIVRVVWDSRGKVSGVIDRVATGDKEAFQAVDAIGAVMVSERCDPPGAFSPARHPTRR